MASLRHAFVIMPFGRKKLPDGTEVDCDDIYERLLAPAIKDADLAPHRADADRRGGSIHSDMFQELLLSEFVVADLTMDNPNVWYEIGVRHALRIGNTVMTYAAREKLPFDIAGQRLHRYSLKNGALDDGKLVAERAGLTAAIRETMGAWRERRISPVYQQLPNLLEPDWKTVKVGEVNQLWQQLEAWESRVETARRNKRPGDILVLAEEMPNTILEFEALRTAAKALVDLGRPAFALDVLGRALKINPDDLKACQLRGIALGRDGKFAQARVVLQALVARHRDGETLGNHARTFKDEWTHQWRTQPAWSADPVAAGRNTRGLLELAAREYHKAFCAAPADHFPGINALTLGRLWEHLSASKLDVTPSLDTVAGGVRWALSAVAVPNFWELFTQGELALVEGRQADAVEAYQKAAALAVESRNRFALDSARQQLDILKAVGFRADIVSALLVVLENAAKQVDPIDDPGRVVVFSGHMIDDPAVRGPGREKPPRFPASKVDAAAQEIRARLDRIGARKGDLGLCGGACGGDLLFAEACLERGMKLELRLARSEPDFLAESVTFADPDRRWEKAFYRVTEDPSAKVLIMPDEVGAAPDGMSVHERCNRWILYSALSWGLRRVCGLALWNGQEGAGPGGTKHMVDLVKKLTGRPAEVIDPAGL